MSPRAPARPHVLAAAVLLLALGCRSKESFRDLSADLPAPLPVTLSPELARLKKDVSFPGFELTFKIGYLLGQLFPESDGAAFLSLLDSDLEMDSQARPWQTSFALSVALQRNGATHRIDARGAADSEESPLAAARAAIEACVRDVHRQATALLDAR
jgi:hypothetical protein